MTEEDVHVHDWTDILGSIRMDGHRYLVKQKCSTCPAEQEMTV